MKKATILFICLIMAVISVDAQHRSEFESEYDYTQRVLAVQQQEFGVETYTYSLESIDRQIIQLADQLRNKSLSRSQKRGIKRQIEYMGKIRKDLEEEILRTYYRISFNLIFRAGYSESVPPTPNTSAPSKVKQTNPKKEFYRAASPEYDYED